MIEQIANRHNMVLARISSEKMPEFSLGDLERAISLYGYSPFVDCFDDADFSVSYFEARDRDSVETIADYIMSLLKKGHQFTTYNGHDAVYVLGAKDMKLGDIGSFVSAVKRHRKIVDSLHNLLEELNND
jgi:hypothetical protein